VYKPHVFLLRLDLGPQDTVPPDIDKSVHVEFTIPNSTVSRTQVRSVSFSNLSPSSGGSGGCGGEDASPEKRVQHLTKYEYRVEMNVSDTVNKTRLPPLRHATPHHPPSVKKAKTTDGSDVDESEYSIVSSLYSDDDEPEPNRRDSTVKDAEGGGGCDAFNEQKSSDSEYD